MFEKNLRLAYLLDFYGDTLDEHTKEIMNSYYFDDLSLSEIAEGVGISRQGVRHIIKKGEDHLDYLERQLGLAARHKELADAAKRLDGVVEVLNGTDFTSVADTLKEIADTIRGKGI